MTRAHSEPAVVATQISAPPEWALLQRHLLELNEANAALVLEKHSAPGGMLYYADDIDDYYEVVCNWGLLYAMGAGKEVFEDAMSIWHASNRTNTVPHGNPVFKWMVPQIHNDYYCLAPQEDATWIPGRRMVNEWHHQSEGNMAFYAFGLADPTIPELRWRAERFADMYIGEDPEASNWDPVHKIIRSPFPTSKGPVFEIAVENVMAYLHGSRAVHGAPYLFKEMGTMATLYPIVKTLEEGWWKTPQRAAEVVDIFNKVVLDGDIANNLAACSLVTNAYLYSGQEQYKKWVLEYVEVWMDRIRQNGGIIPDNVGPTGKIGEMRQGQWWGGLFGWSYYMGFNIIFHGLSAAAECAQLLTGDSAYLDLLRSQLQVIADNSIVGDDGQRLIRYRHDHRGWVNDSEYGHLGAKPMRGQDLGHLYHASLSASDRELITFFRDGEVRRDWNEELGRGEKDDGDSEFARFQFYEGRNPDWPLKILRKDLEQAVQSHRELRCENRGPQQLVDEHVHPRHAVYTRALTQTMFGCPQTVYNGSLLRATLRYFNARAERPGLPPDTAAFVDEIRPDGAGLQLVNLSPDTTSDLILQAGAFGEHEFSRVTWRAGDAQQVKTVDGRYLTVRLQPATAIRLDLEMQRFTGRPSYAHPWHDGEVPVAVQHQPPER